MAPLIATISVDSAGKPSPSLQPSSYVHRVSHGQARPVTVAASESLAVSVLLALTLRALDARLELNVETTAMHVKPITKKKPNGPTASPAPGTCHRCRRGARASRSRSEAVTFIWKLWVAFSACFAPSSLHMCHWVDKLIARQLMTAIVIDCGSPKLAACIGCLS